MNISTTRKLWRFTYALNYSLSYQIFCCFYALHLFAKVQIEEFQFYKFSSNFQNVLRCLQCLEILSEFVEIFRGFFSRNCQKNFRLSLGIKLPEST